MRVCEVGVGDVCAKARQYLGQRAFEGILQRRDRVREGMAGNLLTAVWGQVRACCHCAPQG